MPHKVTTRFASLLWALAAFIFALICRYTSTALMIYADVDPMSVSYSLVYSALTVLAEVSMVTSGALIALTIFHARRCKHRCHHGRCHSAEDPQAQ